MVETNFQHTVQNFDSYAREMIDLYRMFNVKAALKHINNLTKGFQVTRFNRRGEFWYGTDRATYEARKRRAIEKAYDPDKVQHPLTGTGKIVK